MGLFSGKPETKPGPASARSETERSSTSSAKVSADAPTIIGKDAVIKGELASETDMLIEGRVEGKIHGKHRVVIGESGNVKAEIHASVVSVRGEVHGDCDASQKVEITSTGKVFGNISAEAIVVAEGATFRGASKMTKPSQPKPVEKKAAPAKPRSEAQPSAPSGVT